MRRPRFAKRGVCPLALACWTVLVLAFSAAAGELAVPALTGRVVDRAGFFAGGDAARVEQAIRQLEQATGGQMAVLTVPSLDGDALDGFSIRVAEKWKIGRKGQDNGALLVLVRDTHDIRFDIGYGWEGPVNDARVGDIIRGMTPFFRAGRFGDGCVYAVRQLQTFVTGNTPSGALPVPTEGQRDPNIHIGGLSISPVWGFVAWIAFIIVIGTVFGRKRGRTYHGRGSGGGGFFGGGFSGGGFSGGGGGFSGGGGSFGGGGASGKW